MGMPHGGGRMMRQFGREDEVRGHRLAEGTVRRVLGYGRPYRWMLAAFLVTIVVGAVLGVAPPLLLQRIVDDGVLAGNARLVIILAAVVALIALLDAVVGTVATWLSSRIGEGLIRDLRVQVFDHVSSMPLAFFSRTHTGQLVSRLQSDVIGAQQAFTATLSRVVSNLISLVLVLVAMAALNLPLTLASLAFVPLLIIPSRIVGRRVAALQRESMQVNGRLSALMTERFTVSGALLVKLFGRRQREHDTFAEPANARLGIGVRIAMVSRYFAASLTLVAALATAIVYGWGGVLTVEGSMTLGTLTALAGLLGRLYGPLMQLTSVRVDIMSALVSFERVFEVLDLEPLIKDALDAVDLPDGASHHEASIQFDDVWFTYPEPALYSLRSLEPEGVVEERPNEPVLRGVSFRAEPGQTVALVGASGAGKTTITHLLNRLYDATSGRVCIGGHDVRSIRGESLHAAVGYVTQDAHMFHDTIRNNLLYAVPTATEEQMREVLAAAQVLDLVDRLPDGLDTMVGERGYRLSGGERQRFAIARLLLVQPSIVVLDEATAHLDQESEVAVQRALDTAMADRTSVVIAHRLSTVRHADQILVIDRGRVVEQGTHSELLDADGPYARLYASQFQGADQ
ncbi:ABC transporter ATP-binding protein [Aestuariimicrobium ganziense]|uniref:ABC transporter ATP-binding protein n=1 Tax=Aestuariimicrobium ganziense TaxID=2773677 RepID=UPI001F25DE95|nr:ABC transporter ATP-binding protein [Aestuariimicrobium ganziense]